MSNQRYLLIIIAIVTCIFCWIFPASAEVYIYYNQLGMKIITNIKPDWWTDEMSTMDPESVQIPAGEALFPGKFVGDKENRKFHRPTCEQIYNQEHKLAIPESKIIWFESYDEAVGKGFFACDHCKPSNDPAPAQ